MGAFVSNSSTLFTNCSKLEHLSISEFMGFNTDFIAKEFPNLKVLELSSCRIYNFEGFQNFLTLNTQLQQLSIRVEGAEYFSAIAQLVRNLEQLEIICYINPPLRTEHLLQISKLTKLRKLVLRGGFMAPNMGVALMTAFSMEHMALEHLDLCFPLFDSNDIKSIFNLKTLKTLVLAQIDCDSDDDLVSLAIELPHLTKLNCTFRCEYKQEYRPTPVTVLKNIVKAGKHLN